MSGPTTPVKDRNQTQNWLHHILKTYYDEKFQEDAPHKVTIREWSILPAEGETSFAQVSSVDINYTVNDEAKGIRLVAKMMPADPEDRVCMEKYGFNIREIKFYTEVVLTINDVFERCMIPPFPTLPLAPLFYTSLKEGNDPFLVLEDPRNLGYVTQDLSRGLTRSQAEAALEAIAIIHTATFELNKENRLEEKFPCLLTQQQAVETFHANFEKGLPFLLKFLESKKDTVVKPQLEAYSGEKSKALYERILARSDKLNTLVHCNFWCNKLMFREENRKTSCIIRDWQMACCARPAIDVGILLTTSISGRVRREHEKAIIGSYWSNFTNKLYKLGVKDEEINYSYDELQNDLVDGKLFGVLLMIGNFEISLGNAEREDRVLCQIAELINEEVL